MKSETTKSDVYQIITDRMLALLEAGTVPWQKPWRTGAADILPSNYQTRKPYRGANVFLLLCSGFDCPYWLTYKQATEMGGQVKKGSKGLPVVFWNWRDKLEGGKPVLNGSGKPEQVPFLRYYTVFNLEQIDGIAWAKPVAAEGTKWEPLANCEQIVAEMPQAPEIRHGGNRAYYSPSHDFVNMPNRDSFPEFAEYYGVLFHELTHATGHEKRLCRKGIARTDDAIAAFGSQTYGKEELVAEMGAAFLCGQAGILNQTVTNSAAYLASWIKTIKGDPKLVVTAAAQAQRAADFILNQSFTTVPSAT